MTLDAGSGYPFRQRDGRLLSSGQATQEEQAGAGEQDADHRPRHRLAAERGRIDSTGARFVTPARWRGAMIQ